MLIEPARFAEVFEWITEDARESTTPSVVIFVAPDADGMCACRMLCTLLRTRDVQYRVKPAASYEALQDGWAATVHENSDIRSVLLINCGAVVDLVGFLGARDDEDEDAPPALPEHVNVFVLDSHRPYDPSNIANESHVFLLGRETIEELEREEMFSSDEDDEDEDEAEAGAGGRGSGEDGDVSDLEALLSGDEWEEGDRRAKRRKKSLLAELEDGARGSGAASDFDVDEDADDTENVEPSNAARGGAAAKRKGRKKRPATAARGHGTYYYSASVAATLYPLMLDARIDSRELLWLAIVGVTDLYVHGRMEERAYKLEVAQLSDWLEDLATLEGPTAAAAHKELSRVSDFKFMAHRHWSVYESMYHSSYVATRLGIWRRRGKELLDTMLAKMGVPLSECYQKYSCMNTGAKRQLHERVEKWAPTFGLDSVIFTSFEKRSGYTKSLSAADAVLSTSGLLDHTANRERAAGEGGSQDEERFGLGIGWEGNFWEAYESLSGTDWSKVEKGIENAIELQKAIVRQGAWLLDNRTIVHTGPFRYAVLNDSADQRRFTHPLTLLKLALFLLDTIKRGPKPIVLCALNEERNSYLIVGGSRGRNDFGMSFNRAARSTGARIKQHTFDGSIVELQREDLTKFIEYLHSGMS